MKKKYENSEVLLPKNQLSLFGYDDFFYFFINLINKKKLPNSLIFSGPKGIGKSTFTYHLINYLLSKGEKKSYSLENFLINPSNPTYKKIVSNVHQNFFSLGESSNNKNVKIDEVRELLKFLNKSTYDKDLKIVMINNAENLNLSSSNALLKSIEEPKKNTYFFIIHDNSRKILDTIKSRCVEFKFNFKTEKKIFILKKLIDSYKFKLNNNTIFDSCYNETPGNLIKLFSILHNENIKFNNNLDCILYFVEKYNVTKDFETLSFISFYIEKFYYELSLNNNKYLNRYFFNKSRLTKQINDMQTYNLDKKIFLQLVKDVVQNEKR